MNELFPVSLVFLAAPIAFAIGYTLVLLFKVRDRSHYQTRYRTRYERLELEALYGATGYRAR